MSKIWTIILLAMPLLVMNQQSEFNTAKIQTVIDLTERIGSEEMENMESILDMEKTMGINETRLRMRSTLRDIRKLTVSSGVYGAFHAFLINVLNQFEVDEDIDTAVRQLDDYIGRIESLWNFFRTFSQSDGDYNDKTITDYINSVTNTDDDRELSGILVKLHDFVAGDTTFLQLLADKLKDLPPGAGCNLGVSLQDRLYQIYNTIVISHVRGFTMIAYSYTLKALYEKKSYEENLDSIQSSTAQALKDYRSSVKSAVIGVPRAIERCDAVEKTKETYADFTRAMQLIVINEVDLSSSQGCGSTCPDIYNQHPNGYCYDSNYCHKRRCDGEVFDCGEIADSTLCELDADDVKRYRWIKTGYGTVYGNTSQKCDGEWRRATGWRAFYRCDLCACVCVESDRVSEAIRTISLIPQLASTEDNMVVTGIRLIQVDKVIQIQIKQGELLPYGRVDKESVTWKDLPRFVYDSVEISGGGFSAYLPDNPDELKTLKKNSDYKFITYFKRAINFDDVTLPDNYVLTGARFSLTNNEAIQISIHGTRFDYDSGELQTDDSQWIDLNTMSNRPEAYDNDRELLDLTNRDDPLKAPKNVPDSKLNQWTYFDISSHRKDAGQNTVPFFDIQPVDTNPPATLNGVGIYHLGAEGYGGFLALRAISFDRAALLEDDTD